MMKYDFLQFIIKYNAFQVVELSGKGCQNPNPRYFKYYLL